MIARSTSRGHRTGWYDSIASGNRCDGSLNCALRERRLVAGMKRGARRGVRAREGSRVGCQGHAMKPERWARIQEVFDGAAALPEDGVRAYLDQACAGDPELRRSVEKLLAGHRRAGERLDRVVAAAAESEVRRRSAVEPGGRIGPFRILESIAEGGMGVVLLAEQVEGVERKVALKVIRPGIDTREVLARFGRERQALARLDHEGIARIYDAGATDDGLPYFAMEYLPDPSITHFCDQSGLGTRERLALFEEVCRTVQYAHLKGVIHRDLKPSNILVTQRDGRPVTKVIDFGIARALDPESSDNTTVTRAGQWIGTPEYMSPEQAGASPFDIDTRTDVYSLGMVLYELLVGALPFDIDATGNGGISALLRTVREAPTPKPNTRLSTTSHGGEVVARQRSTDLATLLKELRGDLDWIVLKAAEKDRDARYQSTNELAADVRRYLNNQPVTAVPQGTTYRLAKFARRNRGLTTAAALFVLSLISGLGVTAFLARRADGARGLAEARYTDLLRLSDLKRLADARSAADALYPAYPENAPLMEQWLRDVADPLRERLALHRSALDSLRALTAPVRDAGALASEEIRRLVWDTMVYRRVIEDRRGASADPSLLAALEAKADSTAARLAGLSAVDPASWTFDDSRRQWQHDVLSGLIGDMERFLGPDPYAGTVASVERRLEQARMIERLAADTAVRAAWDEAIRETRNTPVYGGLALARQTGLVPLGRDPQSGLWEFWHVESGDRPLPAQPSSPSSWLIQEGTGMVFVLIPGGAFAMGAQSTNASAPNYDPLATEDEGPPHRVVLEPFFLSRYEMTQGQWLRATGTNPSAGNPVRPARPGHYTLTHPVEQVSWTQATSVLGRLGLGLPTEAQWEFAARGGATSPWPWGRRMESLRGAANIADRTMHESGVLPGWSATLSIDDGYVNHAPVGSFRPNGFGLHDVIGNVSERCRDRAGPYGASVSVRSPLRAFRSLSTLGADGERRAIGDENRIVRGASASTAADSARVTTRLWASPGAIVEDTGVRPARRIDPAR